MGLFDAPNDSAGAESLFEALDARVSRLKQMQRESEDLLKKLDRAARDGALASINRTIAELKVLSSSIEETLELCATAGLEEGVRRALASPKFLEDLKIAAEKSGVKDLVVKVDGAALSPARLILRDGAVRLSGRATESVRPTSLVAKLVATRDEFQRRSLDIAPAAERVYASCIARAGVPFGETVPLLEIHAALTALPGSSKTYSLQNLVFDLRARLDTGNSRLPSGNTLRLVRGRDGKGTYFVSKSGEEVYYTGLAFEKST